MRVARQETRIEGLRVAVENAVSKLQIGSRFAVFDTFPAHDKPHVPKHARVVGALLFSTGDTVKNGRIASCIWHCNHGCTARGLGRLTTGNLLQHASLIRSKNLQIYGIDVDPAYIAAAQQSIRDLGLEDSVCVKCMSLSDTTALQAFLKDVTQRSFTFRDR